MPLGRDTLTMVRALGPLWAARPPGAPLKVGVVLTHLVPEGSAMLPRYAGQARLDGLAEVMDKLDQKYGRHPDASICFDRVPELTIKPETVGEYPHSGETQPERRTTPTPA